MLHKLYQRQQKPKFTFYSSLPAVVEEFPVILAKEYNRKWVQPVAESYKKISSDLGAYGKPFTGAVKCPGIFNLLHTGWIVTSWFDFIVDTNGDPGSCGYRLPPFLKSETTDKHPTFNRALIDVMNLNLPHMKIPKMPQSLDLLIKVNTPWAVEIPKGWSLLILPVAYSDETRFTSSTGILKSGDREINPQLFWHVLKGSELIPAGTPLCQLIPIPDNSITFEHECKEFDEQQRKEQDRYFFSSACRFVKKIRNGNT